MYAQENSRGEAVPQERRAVALDDVAEDAFVALCGVPTLLRDRFPAGVFLCVHAIRSLSAFLPKQLAGRG